jgi:hypothetical protein
LLRARLHTAAAIPAMILLPLLIVFKDDEIKKNHPYVRYLAMFNIVICCLFQRATAIHVHPLLSFTLEVIACVTCALLIYVIPSARRCYNDRGHGHEVTEESIANNLPYTKRFKGMPLVPNAPPQPHHYGQYPYNVSLGGSKSGPLYYNNGLNGGNDSKS